MVRFVYQGLADFVPGVWRDDGVLVRGRCWLVMVVMLVGATVGRDGEDCGVVLVIELGCQGYGEYLGDDILLWEFA